MNIYSFNYKLSLISLSVVGGVLSLSSLGEVVGN